MPSTGTVHGPEGTQSLPILRHPRATRDITLQGQRIAYEFRRSRRRTIGFVVDPQGLSVSAPRWASGGDIEAALREKSNWIVRKLREQHDRNRRLDAARLQWVGGESVPYLGGKLQLVLDPQRVATPGGALLDPGPPPLLCLGLPPEAQSTQVRDVVHSWWQRQARRVFEERCQLYAGQLGVQVTRLSLSSAQTRWGSASAGGAIRLNWRLIHYPLSTIDYVVVHELAHLREMNHSPAFWDVVRSVLPQYEAAQAPLREPVPRTD